VPWAVCSQVLPHSLLWVLRQWVPLLQLRQQQVLQLHSLLLSQLLLHRVVALTISHSKLQEEI
jgi:hypothetical protein